MSGSPEPTPALTVDTTGMRCPLPVIELGRRISDVEVGGVLGLVSDDPAAAADVASWCRMREQELVGEADGPGEARTYLIRRLH